MNEERSQLVPEIATQDEQADQQEEVTDNGKGDLVPFVAGDQCPRVRRQPTEEGDDKPKSLPYAKASISPMRADVGQ